MNNDQLRVALAALYQGLDSFHQPPSPESLRWADCQIAATRNVSLTFAGDEPTQKAAVEHVAHDCPCEDARRWRALAKAMGEFWTKSNTALADDLVAAENAESREEE